MTARDTKRLNRRVWKRLGATWSRSASSSVVTSKTGAVLSADRIAARTALAKLRGSADVHTTRSIPRAGCCERGKRISDAGSRVTPSRCMSPTTPTTVVHGSAAVWYLNLNRLLNGSSSGQKRRDMVALMMAVRGEVVPSCSLKERPRNSGTPSLGDWKFRDDKNESTKHQSRQVPLSLLSQQTSCVGSAKGWPVKRDRRVTTFSTARDNHNSHGNEYRFFPIRQRTGAPRSRRTPRRAHGIFFVTLRI